MKCSSDMYFLLLFSFLYLMISLSTYIPTIVGSLASEFLGWSWKTHVGIPMLDIGIPT